MKAKKDTRTIEQRVRGPRISGYYIYDKGKTVVKGERMTLLINGAVQLNIHTEKNIF